MELGKRLRDARKRNNLTQAQLAEKCGLATITIRQYELGKRQPRFDQLKIIADKLGESFVALVSEDHEFTRKEIISSLKFSEFLSSIGYEFYPYDHDNISDAWLCVDSNEKKLYLLHPNDIAALEATLHSYIKFQIVEALKEAEQVPDTMGWFEDKEEPPQD